MEQSRPDMLSTALSGAAQLLATNPALAERQARAILKAVPAQQHALVLLVSARRAQGDTAGARAILELEAKAQPKLAAIQFELGLLLGELGEHDAAIAALSRVSELEPDHPGVWRALGDALAETGRAAEAANAYARQLRSSVKDLEFLEQAANMGDDNLAMAESLIKAFLEIHPTDVAANHMMARICLRSGRIENAKTFYLRALQLAPTSTSVREEYIRVLFGQENHAEAKQQLDIILEQDPVHLGNRGLRATALLLMGDSQQSIEAYEALIRDYPDHAPSWASYAYALRTAGRHDDAIAAYRRSIELRPSRGEAWWGLANLKTFRFEPADVATMSAQLETDDLTNYDRYHLHFALGKALEDARRYADSFEHYRLGNLIRRAEIHYNPSDMTDLVRRSKALYTREFFAARKGAGSQSPDPIFVVGPPRSGSTLIEQILSSHSAVEGTSELPELISLTIRLNSQSENPNESNYLERLPSLDPGEFERLGEEYLERTRARRKLGRPYFIDKMPNNFHHLGFIHLILPNAKIIDARRHPLACCFSNFKQHYSSGIGPTYDLGDLGRYYRDYVALMAHYDEVLPGRVHRVVYEHMVRDPETEIRRLLAWCGLPFEKKCLKFYETERGVLTASSEQVRRPIFGEAVDQWRNYEPWLGPLKAALGPVLKAYPSAPPQ